jgi:hypothetical protein
MSGSLIKISETTVSSDVGSVTLTGIDSTYDVYMVTYNNVQNASDNTNLSLRFTESGTANTTTNYDVSYRYLKSNTASSNNNYTNVNQAYLNFGVGASTNETQQGTIYIFNANNSSQYTFFTSESTYANVFTQNWGGAGGGVFTVNSSVDGVNFLMTVGDISSGTFKLYGLKK